MSPSVAAPFVQAWLSSGSTFQRAAILFGRYSDEPEVTNNPGAVRATVHALYEPPQENAKDFVRFLRDPHEQPIHALAQRLGIEVVGWMLTTVERKGEKVSK
jgi:nuclear protein localization family protein 4